MAHDSRTNGTTTDLRQPADVLVIGGGNAALCAAIEAAHGGARVLGTKKNATGVGPWRST